MRKTRLFGHKWMSDETDWMDMHFIAKNGNAQGYAAYPTLDRLATGNY
jgi:hypothetical protein